LGGKFGRTAKVENMILVDTTVWIDFFNDMPTPQVKRLTEFIKQANICTAGIIITEVLQGIKDDSEFEQVKSLLTEMPISKIPINLGTMFL